MSPDPKKILHTELVTVIVTNYNNEAYLADALSSALNQRYVNVEIIVVDDGSSDNSIEIAHKEAEKDQRIRIIPLLRNFGCYYARNVGIENARGKYICFLDSDDTYHPDKICTQLDRIKSKPHLMAVGTHFQRWDETFTTALSEPRLGEVTVLIKAEVFKEIGFFDSVRFGGDSEFRERLESFYKLGFSVIKSDLYKARTVNGSLTMSGSGKLFEIDKENKLKRTSADVRIKYEKNYLEWHSACKKANVVPFMPFPLRERPFELPSKKQNASPSIAQKTIGCMATFPARKLNLEKTVSSLLPQLDELHIYLNEYTEVPKFLHHDKIKLYIGNELAGDLRDNGKFFSLAAHEGYILTLDDDLNYPENYVSKMVQSIELFNRSSVVGLHGVIFPKEKADLFVRNRTVFHFKDYSGYSFVDLLGTGTTAFHSSTLKLRLADFKTKGICDVWFAAACHRSGVPLVSIARDETWLTPQETAGVNLFSEAQSEMKNGHNHTAIYNESLYGLLQPAPPRAYYEDQMTTKFGSKTLNALQFSLIFNSATSAANRDFITTRRTTVLTHEKHDLAKRRSMPHLHIIVNGWNCSEYVDECLGSLRDQKLGSYTFEVSVVDDGSTDGTLAKISNFGQLPILKIMANDQNYGPAFSRHQAIMAIHDPETIVVLLDLDDWLKPNALKTVASVYRSDTKKLMTCGNWHNQHGKMNPLPFYTDEQINHNLHRTMDKFHAAPLRTFKRKLYNAIEVDDLKGPNGEWLQTCTDVAIMMPLLDQCKSENVHFIKKPLYVYNEKHGLGTLVRFGKPYKEERLSWIKQKKPKSQIAK